MGSIHSLNKMMKTFFLFAMICILGVFAGELGIQKDFVPENCSKKSKTGDTLVMHYTVPYKRTVVSSILAVIETLHLASNSEPVELSRDGTKVFKICALVRREPLLSPQNWAMDLVGLVAKSLEEPLLFSKLNCWKSNKLKVSNYEKEIIV